MLATTVLATRLTPPGVGASVVHRVPLVQRLHAGFGGRLTTVTGGAGFGKTTLVADAVRLSPLPVAWLSCDAGLATPAALGAHLSAALAGAVPGFGAAAGPAGVTAGDVVAAIVNELAALAPDRLLLVLDDVHALPATVAEVVPLLAAHLPAAVHPVFVSREPPFPLGRLRLDGITELGEPDLALTVAEVAGLLAQRGGDPTAAAAVHARTEGWPAAVVLLARPQAGAPGRALAAPESLVEYLAQEVVDVLGDGARRLIDATALCDRLTARMAVHLTGDARAGDTLRGLADGTMLVAPPPGGGEWFRLHAILGEFQASRLAGEGEAARRDLHRRTAGAWLLEGDVPAAVPHLLAAGDPEAAADALAPVAAGLADSPRAADLRAWLDALPREVVDARPQLIAADGMLRFAEHRFADAFRRMREAVDAFLGAGDLADAAASLFRLLEVLETTGEFTLGIAVCEEMLPPVGGADAMLAAALRLRLAVFLGNAGRSGEAAAILADLDAAGAATAPVLGHYARFARAWAVDHPEGRTRHAIAESTRVAEALEASPDGDPLRLLPWVYALRGVMNFALVELQGMDRDIARFAELAPRYGIEAVVGPIVVRGRMAQMLLEGRMTELGDELDRWHDHFMAWRDVGWNYHYPPIAAAGFLAMGRVPQAAAALQGFTAILRDRAPLIEQARLAPDAARLAEDAGEPALARELLAHGLDAAHGTGAPWAVAHAHAVAAALATEPAEAATHLSAAIAASTGEGAEDAWCRIDRAIAPDLLAGALRDGIGDPDVVVRLIAACGGDVVARIAELLEDAPPGARVLLARAASDAGAPAHVVEHLLRDRDPTVREAARTAWNHRLRRPRARVAITSFGRLEILREGHPLDPAAFTRQKSRTLLAAVLASGGRASRDRLCAWLWPDLPAERAAGALRSTLHDLRRAVEPEVDAGSPHAVLRGDGESVALTLAEGDAWDLAGFRALVAQARAADEPAARVAPLAAAVERSTGPFLAEWEFEDWAIEARRAVAAERAEALAALADALTAAGRPADAIPHLRELCAAEPEREEWHRRLMTAYRDAGERGMALRQFHVLRAGLRRDQGIAPAAETRALYARILENPEAL